MNEVTIAKRVEELLAEDGYSAELLDVNTQVVSVIGEDEAIYFVTVEKAFV